MSDKTGKSSAAAEICISDIFLLEILIYTSSFLLNFLIKMRNAGK